MPRISRGTGSRIVTVGGGGGAVDSVNGQTGAVTLTADSIAATATRLWLTTAERDKLTGVEAGATVTDTASVAAAGAVMVTDVDDDPDFTGVNPTGLTTREAIAAYVALNGGGGGGDMTAGEILTALLTVDGPGSLLNADLLDGFDATAFAAAGHNHTGVYQPVNANLTALAGYTLGAFADDILAVADAAALRTLAGLVIGTHVQAQDATLAAIAALSTAADRYIYFSGADEAQLGTITSFARTILDDTNAAGVRTTLGLGTLATQSTVSQRHFLTYTYPGSLVAGPGTVRWYAPVALTIENVVASVSVAPAGTAIRVDANIDAITMFTTQANRPNIAIGGFVDTSSIPDVTVVPAGSYLTVDIDQTGNVSTPGDDLVITFVLREAIS